MGVSTLSGAGVRFPAPSAPPPSLTPTTRTPTTRRSARPQGSSGTTHHRVPRPTPGRKRCGTAGAGL